MPKTEPVTVELIKETLRAADAEIYAAHPLFDPETANFFYQALDELEDASTARKQPRVEIKAVFDPTIFEANPFAVLASEMVPDIPCFLHENVEGASPNLGQFSEIVLRDWLPTLFDRFAQMSRPTLTLEFNIARFADADLTIDQYLRRFLERSERDILFAEYPVLLSRLRSVAAQQLTVLAEFLTRLQADWGILADYHSMGRDELHLTALQPAQGDLHCDGRSVVIVAFNQTHQIVYKPRDLSIEQRFNAFLQKLQDSDQNLDFGITHFIARDGYGWAEFIASSPCESEADCKKYYQNFGSLLAVVHQLGGYDFHHENLIAAGVHPVIIDLETLLYSVKNGQFLGKSDPYFEAIEFPAVTAQLQSVMTTLMLPQNARDEHMSGIDGVVKRPEYARLFNQENALLEKQRIEDTVLLHRPHFKGEVLDPADFVDDVVVGFERAYFAMLGGQRQLTAKNGPLHELANAQARVVLRDTQVYANLIEHGYHPDLLRRPEARLMHFLNLWPHVVAMPSTIPVFLEEIRQLMQDDVPYFFQLPKGRTIYATAGSSGLLEMDTSGLEGAEARIMAMNAADCDLQTWFIRGALEKNVRSNKSQLPVVDAPPASAASLDRSLGLVHEQLVSGALFGNDMADWLTLTPTPKERLAVGPVDLTLYNGVTGICLYLHSFARAKNRKEDWALFHQALRNLETQLLSETEDFRLPGAMNGYAGVAYLFVILSQYDPENYDRQRAIELLDRSIQLYDPATHGFDLTGGAAGILMVALAGFEATSDLGFLQIARQMTRALITLATETEDGVGWFGDGEKPLTGYAHGAAGAIAALARMRAVDPNAVSMDVINRAIDQENSSFDDRAQNWVDWRHKNLGMLPWDAPNHFEAHWCNGAAGIGMSRLQILASGCTRHDAARDIEAAARTTLKNGTRLNHSLCHGDLGNIGIVLALTAHLGDMDLAAECWAALGQTVYQFEDGQFLGGASRELCPPDLMTGLSGIGYGLLRILNPETTPDVLTLRPLPNA